MTPIHLVLVGFAPFNEGLFFFKNTIFLNPQKDFLFFLMLFWIVECGFLLFTYYLPSKNQRSIFFINKIAFD